MSHYCEHPNECKNVQTVAIQTFSAVECRLFAVGSPTVPEVHHTRTILFAAEFLPARVAVNTIFPNYIFTQTFLRIESS